MADRLQRRVQPEDFLVPEHHGVVSIDRKADGETVVLQSGKLSVPLDRKDFEKKEGSTQWRVDRQNVVKPLVDDLRTEIHGLIGELGEGGTKGGTVSSVIKALREEMKLLKDEIARLPRVETGEASVDACVRIVQDATQFQASQERFECTI